MIPIRDDAPRYGFPYINYFLLALNTLVFLYELALAPRVRELFVTQFGLVPAKILLALAGQPHAELDKALIPVLTSMFLHAGFIHLLSNMWVLYIFGDNIESYLGHFRFLLFYLLSGVSATLVHLLFNLNSPLPTVGASGAIAGVMGAYFVLYPSARVLTIMPFFFLFFLWLPAWVVLGYWFLAQFLSGAATTIAAAGRSVGGVAFWAHVGGFVAGIILIKLFPSHRRRFRYDN